MPFDPQIHHRKSIRLKDYDYSQEGLYFITICTKNRECLFGEIVNADPNNACVKLSTIGETVANCWLQIPEHFPNTILHEFIVMPNHVHGIIQIRRQTVGAQYLVPSPVMHQAAQFQKVISGSIASIIRGYKSGVTTRCRKNAGIYTIWQRNYHEHIIRNEAEYNKIRNYILNNPSTWKEDKFFK